jgi:hypothetical protein
MIGPEKQVESAMHFFRALRVYPNPVELLMSESSLSPVSSPSSSPNSSRFTL